MPGGGSGILPRSGPWELRPAESERPISPEDVLRSGENVSMAERANDGDLSSSDPRPTEIGTETFDRERDLSLLKRLEKEMDEVQAALDRLEDGTYGRCEACGRPIARDRLDALPATRYCAEHDRGREVPSLQQ